MTMCSRQQPSTTAPMTSICQPTGREKALHCQHLRSLFSVAKKRTSKRNTDKRKSTQTSVSGKQNKRRARRRPWGMHAEWWMGPMLANLTVSLRSIDAFLANSTLPLRSIGRFIVLPYACQQDVREFFNNPRGGEQCRSLHLKLSLAVQVNEKYEWLPSCIV